MPREADIFATRRNDRGTWKMLNSFGREPVTDDDVPPCAQISPSRPFPLRAPEMR